jgi:hypothetical protein
MLEPSINDAKELGGIANSEFGSAWEIYGWESGPGRRT